MTTTGERDPARGEGPGDSALTATPGGVIDPTHRGPAFDHQSPTTDVRPASRPAEHPSRWLLRSLAAVAVVVLASHVVFVLGLVRSGVTWTDGGAAYGVPSTDLVDALPPGIAHLVGLVTVFSVLLGPLVLLSAVAVAGTALARSRRRRSGLSASAVVRGVSGSRRGSSAKPPCAQMTATEPASTR